MEITTVRTQPYADQAPGTAGLRKTVAVFQQPNYLENFVQSIFDILPGIEGGRLVLGGDGRYGNRDAIQTVLRMAAANGVASVALGRGGLLSTPAASALIRHEQAVAGLILSASHNPAGEHGDFGIKFNSATGGQASESLTRAVAARSRGISEYRIVTGTPPVDIDRPGSVFLCDMRIDVVDPVAHYADLMEKLFDFDAIRNAVDDGFTLRFDAMNAVTGVYASELFVTRLGLPTGSVLRAVPKEDFGGTHADPNRENAKELFAVAFGEHAPDLSAASDGDGDRNLILGPRTVVMPSDSLAVLAANASRVPGYRDGLVGVARSMPTTHAVDRVAGKLGIPCFETPAGWRYFCNLLDDGRVTLCGEESFGTSSDHCREKDGLWAILFWLNLLATTGRSVPELLSEHWREYGRTFSCRHDYYIADAGAAHRVIEGLRESLGELRGRSLAGLTVLDADDFRYDDPVDGTRSEHQGLRVKLERDARICYRLSGTDTSGATLRVYVEGYTDDPTRLHDDAGTTLARLTDAARDLARITPLTGMVKPTMVL